MEINSQIQQGLSLNQIIVAQKNYNNDIIAISSRTMGGMSHSHCRSWLVTVFPSSSSLHLVGSQDQGASLSTPIAMPKWKEMEMI